MTAENVKQGEDQDELWDVKQAARYLKMSASFVYEHVEAIGREPGRLPGVPGVPGATSAAADRAGEVEAAVEPRARRREGEAMIYYLLNAIDRRSYERGRRALIAAGGFGRYPASATGRGGGSHVLIAFATISGYWSAQAIAEDGPSSPEADAAATKMIRAWYRLALRTSARGQRFDRAAGFLRRMYVGGEG